MIFIFLCMLHEQFELCPLGTVTQEERNFSYISGVSDLGGKVIEEEMI